MAEFQRTFQPVGTAAHDDVGGQEAQNLEILRQLLSIPDLPVASLKRLSATSLGIDLAQSIPAQCFSVIGHISSVMNAGPETTLPVHPTSHHLGLGTGRTHLE